MTAHTVEAMHACVAEFMKRMPTGNCKNCGAANPAIRRRVVSQPGPANAHALKLNPSTLTIVLILP